MLGQRSDSASLNAVRKDLGLDKPILQQYLKYINDVSFVSIFEIKDSKSFFFFDEKIYGTAIKLFKTGKTHRLIIKSPYLRRSYQNQRYITDIIKDALPATFILAIVSIIFASIAGIGLGIVSALKFNSWIDRCLMVITSFGMSLPSFFAAILIGWLFAFVLGNITGLNLTGNLFEIDDFGEGSHLMLKNLILPAFTLGIRPLSVVTQLTRKFVARNFIAGLYQDCPRQRTFRIKSYMEPRSKKLIEPCNYFNQQLVCLDDGRGYFC